jgi:hypothetical protein
MRSSQRFAASPFYEEHRGALRYVEVEGDLEVHVAHALARGFRLILPATELGAMGALAIVADADGNAVGLHASRG